jgi:hypothetical protein
MALSFVDQPTVEVAGAPQSKRSALLAELAKIQGPPKDSAYEEECRRLEEDIAFARADKAAKPGERIGRKRVEPGQLIFRQMSRAEIQRIAQADVTLPGKPEMTLGQAAEARRIATEQVVFDCLKAPSREVYEQWRAVWPTLDGAYIEALNEHNDVYRRERSEKS